MDHCMKLPSGVQVATLICVSGFRIQISACSNYISQETKLKQPKNGFPLNTDILTHLELEVIESAQKNSTTQPRTTISPTSSMELFLHGKTVMHYPPRHCMSTTSFKKKCRMQCIQCTPLLGTIHIRPGPQPN